MRKIESLQEAQEMWAIRVKIRTANLIVRNQKVKKIYLFHALSI